MPGPGLATATPFSERAVSLSSTASLPSAAASGPSRDEWRVIRPEQDFELPRSGLYGNFGADGRSRGVDPAQVGGHSSSIRQSYARRTAAERTYASLADPSVGGIRRGWCRLFGRTKNTLMYVLAVVVRNVRILESFERRQAEEARRVAVGPTRGRRRRHQRDTPAPVEQPMAEVETAPG